MDWRWRTWTSDRLHPRLLDVVQFLGELKPSGAVGAQTICSGSFSLTSWQNHFRKSSFNLRTASSSAELPASSTTVWRIQWRISIGLFLFKNHQKASSDGAFKSIWRLFLITHTCSRSASVCSWSSWPTAHPPVFQFCGGFFSEKRLENETFHFLFLCFSFLLKLIFFPAAFV